MGDDFNRNDNRIYLALIHYPVVDKNGQIIAAAVTGLDLHDIARASRTFGVIGFYVVTPLQDQQTLVQRLMDHWVSGVGAQYNPDRREALALIRLQPSLEATIADIVAQEGKPPWIVATSARKGDNNLTYAGLSELMGSQKPVLLIFGTAWGLAPEVWRQADFRLDPIQGVGNYNHLAVRSAVSIVLDRLCGENMR